MNFTLPPQIDKVEQVVYLGDTPVTPTIYNACVDICKETSQAIQYQEIGYFLALPAICMMLFFFLLNVKMEISEEGKEIVLALLLWISFLVLIGGLAYIGFVLL